MATEEVMLMYVAFFTVIVGMLSVVWSLISPPNVHKKRVVDEKLELIRNRFTPSKIPSGIDVIVIGSGIGGMSAASILSKHGKKVLVLERHDKLGGCTHTFTWSRKNTEGDGYSTCEFDTGCHYCAVDMAYDTARSGTVMKYVTDGHVKWNDLGDPYDRLVLPHDPRTDANCPNNDSYDFLCGAGPLVDHISERINPNEPTLKPRLRAFLEFCRVAHNTIIPLYLVRILPRCLERFFVWALKSFHQYGRITTDYVMKGMLGHGFSSQDILSGKKLPDKPEAGLENTWRRLCGVMVHPLGDYACQPRDSSIVAHSLTSWYYMNGASYTDGATQSISESAARVVYEYGGECLVNAHVDEILIENDQAVGVRICKATSLEPGSEQKPEMMEVRAPTIVCATGVHNLYNKLLPKQHNLVKEFKATNKTIPSFGHMYLFVAIRGDAEEVGIPKTNTWYFNGYDTDDCFDKYFAEPTKHIPPTVYLGFPCTKDPTWKERHPGVSNCILISDGKYEWFEKWEALRTHKRGDQYDELKEEFSQKLLEVLYSKVPQVKGKVLWYELGTPISDSTFLSSYRGGSYGTRCNVDYFSTESMRWLMRGDTEIKGLFMAGQDAWTPAVAGAMYGGLLGSIKVLGAFQTIGLIGRLLNCLATAMRRDRKVSYINSYYLAVQRFLGKGFVKPKS